MHTRNDFRAFEVVTFHSVGEDIIRTYCCTTTDYNFLWTMDRRVCRPKFFKTRSGTIVVMLYAEVSMFAMIVVIVAVANPYHKNFESVMSIANIEFFYILWYCKHRVLFSKCNLYQILDTMNSRSSSTTPISVM